MEDSEAEASPLLRSEGRVSKRQASYYLGETVSAQNADLLLLVCCFITGLIDASSYNAWSVFMGMQTGNTIFLALSTANLPPGSDDLKWARSIISILSLMVGSLVTSRAYQAFGATRRSILFVSFLLQTICIAIAALLVNTDAVPDSTPKSKLIFIAIPFLAAQSGAQIVSAKSLGFSELPTTVLTTTYNDLAGDTELWAWRNPKRNRRVGAIGMILVGAISGGWLSRWGKSLSLVLWLGAALKLVITMSWLLFAAESKI